MTDQEKIEFKQIVSDVNEIKREIIGSERNEYTDGIAFQVRRLEEDVRELKDSNKRIRTLLVGMAIGIGLGGLVFGFITLKEFLGFVR